MTKKKATSAPKPADKPKPAPKKRVVKKWIPDWALTMKSVPHGLGRAALVHDSKPSSFPPLGGTWVKAVVPKLLGG